MAFPLKQRKISGYVFLQKTFYTPTHLGVDYFAVAGTPIYAPFDGDVVAQLKGIQGGLTVWFKPVHDDVVMRFMHLSKFAKSGKVKKGDIIGYTGNTGALTKNAHLHLDLSKKVVDIKNIKNFIDPEKYRWT